MRMPEGQGRLRALTPRPRLGASTNRNTLPSTVWELCCFLLKCGGFQLNCRSVPLNDT